MIIASVTYCHEKNVTVRLLLGLFKLCSFWSFIPVSIMFAAIAFFFFFDLDDLTLIRLGFLRVVFSGTPLTFQEVLI